MTDSSKAKKGLNRRGRGKCVHKVERKKEQSAYHKKKLKEKKNKGDLIKFLDLVLRGGRGIPKCEKRGFFRKERRREENARRKCSRELK